MSDASEDRPGGPGEPDGTVLAALSELRASLASLESHAARDHDRAQAREAVIDRLHAEVERLRAGEARALLRPAVTDLWRLREDLLTQARSVPEVMNRDEVTALLESYADSVVLILERCGIVAVRPAEDTRFDPRQHQVSDIAETGDRDLDGLVARVMSDGYAEADDGRQVAPARVVVYRHVDGALPGDQNGQPR
ncbi:MAG TPA: nucleotide exchange factor GrpE [Streptosporangiaceae bacterium]|nr:nucleotide exchange factor GrpE [Streptosporangiaceae bacterium]